MLYMLNEILVNSRRFKPGTISSMTTDYFVPGIIITRKSLVIALMANLLKN